MGRQRCRNGLLMKPAAVDYLRKKRLDHRGIPTGSTSPYGGISEADINTTGPLEEPLAAPLDDATAHEADPLPQPAEVFAGHEQQAGTEDAGPRHSTVPAQVFQSIAAVAPSTVPSVPQDTHDADEIDAAREADRASRLTAGLELAGRQLVGGITRTPVGQGIGAAPSEVPTAMARVKSRQERAAEAIRLKRQGVMDASTLDLQASEAEKNRRPPVVGKDNSQPTPYQQEMLKDRDLDREARLSEQQRKAKEAEDRRARAAAALKAKAKDDALLAEGANIPFAGGMFKPRPGAKVEKQIAKEASDKASLYNAAITGIDDFSAALGQYAAHPGPETRDTVVAKANGVGGALNTAQGQGAMSEGEKKEMAAALGVDVLSPAGISAFISSMEGDKGQAAQTITRRARAVRQSMIEMAKGNLKSKNYDFEAPKGAKPSPGPGYVRGKVNGKPGWINQTKNDWEPD